MEVKIAALTWFLGCRDRLRKWAYDNACMLTFLSGMFFFTWALIVVLHFV
jgi:hypothetical protein